MQVMRVNPAVPNYNPSLLENTKNNKKQVVSNPLSCEKNYNSYSQYIANINKVSFGFNDRNWMQPLKKFYYVVSGHEHIYEDEYTKHRIFNGGFSDNKKWVGAPAYELLTRTPEEAVRSICTLNNDYRLSNYVDTPNYGHNWGRRANYIEINPRTIANREYGKVSEGFINAIKLLPGIPPSGNSFANCVILSQLYPAIYGDGYQEWNSSLYTMDLGRGISRNLTSDWLERDGVQIYDRDLAVAFNDLAHMRNLKTGFRMLLSEGQMKINGESFNWDYHEQVFINACVEGIKLGFDAIYFDSGKHAGGDYNGYRGIGRTPDYGKMQWITQQIREKTGRQDLAFIAEKADMQSKYEQMGITAGTDWGKSWDRESVKHESKKQSWNNNYAAGPEVSDDNDDCAVSFENRLGRIDNCLFGYEYAGDKIPSYMQMHDIFPLSFCTNTHTEMEHCMTKGHDLGSHVYNIFNTSDSAQWYRNQVNDKFFYALQM